MTVKTKIENARKALEQIKDYTQEQVDVLVYESAKIIFENAEPLARLAVDETGLGKYEHKIGKNTGTASVFWEYLKDKKSVGVLNETPDEEGLIHVAHPVGVIAAITPATNPTVTPLGNFMHAVKGKNAMIVSPSPRAEKTTTDTVDLIRKALEKNGAPKDLIQVIPMPTIDLTEELMAKCDLVLATGGPGLTKAAYLSGTPAYGVGPGNSPTILDRDFDLDEAAEITLEARFSDNGILCDCTEVLFYPSELEDKLFEALRKVGMIVYSEEAEVDKIRQALFPVGRINPDLTGKDAPVIAKAAGLSVPGTTEVIAVKINGVGDEDGLNQEKMAPILALKSYETFEEAVDMSVKMLEYAGIGHTAGIFSHTMKHILYAGEKIPVARLLVNQSTTDAWGPPHNGLTPAVSEGCGTWGNNILAGNVDYTHLLNISKIAMKLDADVLDPESIFKK